MPRWEIKFPPACSTDPIPVIAGRFIAAGVGPPGRVYGVYADLYEDKDGRSTLIDEGRAVRTDHDVNGVYYWTVMFFLGGYVIDPQASYTIELLVREGASSTATRKHHVSGYKLVAFRAAAAAASGPAVGPDTPNIVYPPVDATLSRHGVNAYGSAPGETVTGADVGGVESSPPQPMGAGWWVSFGTLPSGAPAPSPWTRTLTVRSTSPPSATRVIKLND